jgi:hypothetical protein
MADKEALHQEELNRIAKEQQAQREKHRDEMKKKGFLYFNIYCIYYNYFRTTSRGVEVKIKCIGNVS